MNTGTIDDAIRQFLQQTPPGRLSKNLRNLLLEHIIVQKDGYSFSMDDLLHDIINLFELLDTLESGSTTTVSAM